MVLCITCQYAICWNTTGALYAVIVSCQLILMCSMNLAFVQQPHPPDSSLSKLPGVHIDILMLCNV